MRFIIWTRAKSVEFKFKFCVLSAPNLCTLCHYNCLQGIKSDKYRLYQCEIRHPRLQPGSNGHRCISSWRLCFWAVNDVLRNVWSSHSWILSVCLLYVATVPLSLQSCQTPLAIPTDHFNHELPRGRQGKRTQ